MDKKAFLAVRLSLNERNAAAIAARRRGFTTQDYVRQLLSKDEDFRRELTRVRHEMPVEEPART